MLGGPMMIGPATAGACEEPTDRQWGVGACAPLMTGAVELDQDAQDGNGILLIARAADILRLLHDHPLGLTQAEIGERLHLPRSTISRTISALRAEEFVAPANTRGPYRLGPAISRMATAVQRAVVMELHPMLEALARSADETAQLFAFESAGLTLVDQVVTPNRLQVTGTVGETAMLHTSAAGKMLLAGVSPEERRRLTPRRLPARTSATITDRAALLVELNRVRTERIAFERCEDAEGVCAIATALESGASQKLFAVVTMPAGRFEDRELELADLLLSWARRLPPG